MTMPGHTGAHSFPRYLGGHLVADSDRLRWPGLYVRRYRFPRVVDGFLVPATPEPLISCNLSGAAQFEERDIGGKWILRPLQREHIFVTHSKTPYEVRWRSPAGEELDVIHIHLGTDQCDEAFKRIHGDKKHPIEVTEFYGRDEALASLCRACAGMLDSRASGKSRRVAALAECLTAYIAEKYTSEGTHEAQARGGLPAGRLAKVELHVQDHLADEISLEALAKVAGLSPFHFARVFKEATGMTPLQFVTRERVLRAQQMIRGSSRSLLDISMDVGYSSPSHFAQVFRRQVGMTPTAFRNAL